MVEFLSPHQEQPQENTYGQRTDTTADQTRKNH